MHDFFSICRNTCLKTVAKKQCFSLIGMGQAVLRTACRGEQSVTETSRSIYLFMYLFNIYYWQQLSVGWPMPVLQAAILKNKYTFHANVNRMLGDSL